MVRRLFAALALGAATPALAAPPAGIPAGDCRIRVDATPSSWVIRGYDPYDTTLPEATFSVTFTNESGQECRFIPAFDLDQPPFGLSTDRGREVGYALLDLTNSQDVTPRPGRARGPAGSLRPMVVAANQSATVLYRLLASADEVSVAGTLTENVTLEARDDEQRVIGGTRVVLGLEVLPSARIGLAGAYTMNNGHAVVSLGELREGPAPVPLQLRVSSTGRYDLQVTSLNSGRLRLGASEWDVPYNMTVGGMPVDLSGIDTLSGPTEEGLTRTALPIQFNIGDVSRRRAGVYSDLISISVSAR